MFSPLEAVQGYDRTFVRRMSTADYLEEVHAEEADITGKPLVIEQDAPRGKLQPANVNHMNGGLPGILKKKAAPERVSASTTTATATAKPAGHVWEFERRREALTSHNPNVTFTSRYPTYDRLGHELSVLYQFQDMTVQQELRRIATLDARTRKSGVRLSAEIELDRTASRVLSIHTRSTLAAAVERESSAGKSLVRPSHVHHALPPLSTREDFDQADADALDVSVSGTTHMGGSLSRASSMSSHHTSRLASARPSEFTIYRDTVNCASGRRAHVPATTVSAPSAGLREGEGEGGGMDYRTSHAPAVLLHGHSTSPAPCDARQPPAASASSRARSLSGPPLAPGLSEPAAPHPYLVGALPENGMAQGGAASLPATGARGFLVARGRLPLAPSAGRKRWASVSEPPPTIGGEGERDGNPRTDAMAKDVVRAETAAAQKQLHPPTPPLMMPLLAEEVQGDRVMRVSPVPLNTTTATPQGVLLARESTAIRPTRQLFRGTLLGSVGGGRGTTTVSHKQLIPGTAYGGPTAPHIPAHAVAGLIEDNLEACAALSAIFVQSSEPRAPELQCGHVVALGGDREDTRRWFRLLRFVVTADAYEAVEVEPIAKRDEAPREAEVSAEMQAEVREVAPADPGVSQEEVDKEVEKTATEESEPETLRAHEEQPPTAPTADVPTTITPTSPLRFRLKRDEENAAADVEHHSEKRDDDDDDDDVSPRFLVYRWRDSLLPGHGNEARRAAHGLALVAPEVHVSGYGYADGSGVTVLALPLTHRAVPVASLPHTHADSFLCCVKLLVKSLSCTVPHRTIHGNLESLAEVFLSAPTVDLSEADDARDASTLSAPLIVPVHWERLVDFSMFTDRAAGRSIPYDPEDSRSAESPVLLSQSTDIRDVLQTVLEHKFASSLPAQSYAALQRLLVMSKQPAPMANLLVEISNLLASLPSYIPALYRAHGAAVNFYKRIYVD